MRTFFVIIFFSLSKLSFGQNIAKCDLLKNIFAEKYAERTFEFQQSYKDSPTIIFIDTANFFRECHDGKINGRNMKITHDSSYVSKINRYNVLVFIATIKYDEYKIEFYSKLHHTLCVIMLKKRKDKFHILKISCAILD